MKKKGYKRRYIVDCGFQFGQAAAVIIANIFTVLLISALLSWFYLLVWDNSLAVNHNNRIVIYVGVCIALVVFLSVFFSFRRSRIIAGMMKKLHNVLDDAARGVIPERAVVFRSNDYFSQLEVPLNGCLQTIRKQDGFNKYAAIADLEKLHKRIEIEKLDSLEVVSSLEKILGELKK